MLDTNQLKDFVYEQKCIPWRTRHGMEQWVEGNLRKKAPSFYRLLRFGRLNDIAKAVTCGPRHHFFGYYDKCPWDASGRYLLGLETTFMHRPPGPDDIARIGMVDLANSNRWSPLAETHAWNWQQGAMLRWHPIAPDRLIIYNDRLGDRFVSVIHDVCTNESRVLPLPIYDISPDGLSALSLNFARLHQNRPGYGYAGLPDPWAEVNHPKDDGIYWMDMNTGEYRLVVSLNDVAFLGNEQSMHGVTHWFNHLHFNPDGTRFVFLH